MDSPNSNLFREYFFTARWTYDPQAQLVKNEFNRVITDVGLTDPSAKSLTDREGYMLSAAPDLFQSVDELVTLIRLNCPAVLHGHSSVQSACRAIAKAMNDPDDE